MSGTFADLLKRYAERADGSVIVETSLDSALATGADPLNLIAYLGSLDIQVRSLSDLLQVNALNDEEELSAHAVSEGVAVSIASDGSWVLFRP